jgi:hypothetical protein
MRKAPSRLIRHMHIFAQQLRTLCQIRCEQSLVRSCICPDADFVV